MTVMALTIPVLRLDDALPLPVAARTGDAGLDLVARDDVTLAADGGRATVRTGLAIALPDGHAGFVLPRSGLASRHGVTVLNAPGLIDSGYRGEVMVPLVNHDPDHQYHVSRGERIAQLVVLPVPAVTLVAVDALPPAPGDGESSRGDAGFGSTGR